MSGGKLLQTFDTDCAKIGVLICYDVEFPELSRLMADQGMQILFVPFLTDTQNAYSRVRVCAQARAIENECFVVIATDTITVYSSLQAWRLRNPPLVFISLCSSMVDASTI